MNWRNFTRGLTFSTLVFGALLLILTFFTSPELGPTAVVLYFLSLFFFTFGASSLMLFTFRRWRTRNEVIFANIKTSLRQGFLIASFLVSILVLSSMDMLTWWDASILTIIFILIELFFKTRS